MLLDAAGSAAMMEVSIEADGSLTRSHESSAFMIWRSGRKIEIEDSVDKKLNFGFRGGGSFGANVARRPMKGFSPPSPARPGRIRLGPAARRARDIASGNRGLRNFECRASYASRQSTLFFSRSDHQIAFTRIFTFRRRYRHSCPSPCAQMAPSISPLSPVEPG